MSRARRVASVLARGALVGGFWSAIWRTTYSWPVLFAAIWVVIALTNPRRTPTFPGVAWVLFARDLWRDTRRGKMVVAGHNSPQLPTTQRSQHGAAWHGQRGRARSQRA